VKWIFHADRARPSKPRAVVAFLLRIQNPPSNNGRPLSAIGNCQERTNNNGQGDPSKSDCG
jgi:hypothetical protein